ncbi:BREX system ATP-binding domain-containing protein [Actinomadura nitritigenes]|uniref:BREX system ATP-binding domain-containing protein n=1 Tax=Actinomadura nitritigenes TaxID=134602 RepID=UPI003D8BD3BD
MFLVITGAPAFCDGQQGAQRLPPLAQRLATDFSTDPRFDSSRAIQLRLTGFDLPKLVELGTSARELFRAGARNPDRVAALVDDGYVTDLAKAVSGGLGGQVGIAPGVFLRKLVADVLDRVDYVEGFDPLRDYHLTLTSSELSEVERNAAASTVRAFTADEVELDL